MVQADADCTASCEADASFQADCTEPSIVITFTGTVDAEAELNALIATLEANLGAILSIGAQAELLVDATVDFVGSLGGAIEAALDIGVEAADCVRLAIQAQVAASAKVRVSVMASASVSGSVAGGT
jgi:hypothetical protein